MRRTLKNSTERLRFIFTKSRNQNGTFLGVFVLTLNFFFSEIEDENEFFSLNYDPKKIVFWGSKSRANTLNGKCE